MTDNVRKIIKKIETKNIKDTFYFKIRKEDFFTKIDEENTFLDYLLKKKIFITDKKPLLNSAEAVAIYLKNGENLFLFNITEEMLFSKIGDKRLIDLIVEKNALYYINFKNIKNNLEIVDILIRNNEFGYLHQLSDELVSRLMSKDTDGKYEIEKYFNNGAAIKILVGLIKNKEVIGLCKKYKKEYLLEYVNEVVLLSEVYNNKTLLDILLEKNIIPRKVLDIPDDINFIKKLISKGMYKYFEEASEKVLLTKLDDNKTLLEYLIDKDRIKKFNITVVMEETVSILLKKNKLELVTSIFDNTLLKPARNFVKNAKGYTLMEYMIDNGYKPFSRVYFITNDKILSIICKKKAYYYLSGKILKEEQLFLKVNKRTLLIDELLDKNIDFKVQSIGSKIIVNKLIEKRRIDLLLYCQFDILMEKVDNEMTYLDYILDTIINRKLRCNLNDIFINRDKSVLAKLYIYIAERNMIRYVDELKVDVLLDKNNGITLLEELLKLDKDIMVNKILTSRVKNNLKIATMLRSYNIKQEDVDLPLENNNYVSNYLDEIKSTYGIGPLYEEGEYLLAKLKELFLRDGKSNQRLIDKLVSGYRDALIVDYNQNIKELRNLVEIKEKNIDKFFYLLTGRNAYFSSNDGIVYCGDDTIATLIHETGHALHYYLKNGEFLNDLDDLFNARRDKILSDVERFANNYQDIKEKLQIIVGKKYAQFFEGYFDDIKREEIFNFLKKSRDKKKEEFRNLDISEENLDIILNSIFTVDEYIVQ